MAYENKAGLGVNNQYGPRDTGGAIGLEHGYNSTHTLEIQITPEFLNTGFVPPVVIPKGALFTKALLRVDEAFTLTGTTPGVAYGAVGAETTNGIALTQAELQTVGTKVPASAGVGTWAQNSATGTTAAAKIGKALTGTTPAVTGTAGKAVLILHFVNATKA
jgi:hypothetical protein